MATIFIPFGPREDNSLRDYFSKSLMAAGHQVSVEGPPTDDKLERLVNLTSTIERSDFFLALITPNIQSDDLEKIRRAVEWGKKTDRKNFLISLVHRDAMPPKIIPDYFTIRFDENTLSEAVEQISIILAGPDTNAPPAEEEPNVRPKKRATKSSRPDNSLVKQVQEFLKVLDMYNGVVDGINGPMTSAAIRNFQEKHSLDVNGLADLVTHEKLIEVVKQQTKQGEVKTEKGGTKAETKATSQPKAAGFYRSAKINIRNGIEPSLGVQTVAEELAQLIRNLKTDEIGKMIGIFGHWGRGKTFLMDQVWEVLKGESEEKSDFIPVRFHAWKFQDTNASWAYLYEAFAQKYFEKRGNPFQRWYHSKGKLLDLNIKRQGLWPFFRLAFTGAGAIVAWWLAVNTNDYQTFWFIITALGFADGVRLGFKYFDQFKLKEKASEVFSKYFNKPSFKDLLGVQSEIQQELSHLLECWLPLENGEPKKRILLFVDDIDRCSEDRIVQLIDALRVMLEDENISRRVTVLAAIDERMLKRAIKWKYHALLEADKILEENTALWQETTAQITSEYMDKLFISGIKLGTLTVDERKEIYKGFSRGKVVTDDTPTAQKQEIKQTVESNVTPAEQLQRNLGANPMEVASMGGPLALDRIRTQARTGQAQSASTSVAPENGTAPAQGNFELTADENDFLLGLMHAHKDATPRQIRVFYYRYLLARNLLTSSLVASQLDEMHQTDVRNKLLAMLLSHYTVWKANGEIAHDRRNLLQSEWNLSHGDLIPLLKNSDQRLAGEVLEVLEMVIAY